MTDTIHAPQLTDHFAPGSGAFRIELYEGNVMTGSLNASPSVVREHEVDLDGIWSTQNDSRRGSILIGRWLLNAHEYGYDTAHMITSSRCVLRSFQTLLQSYPLGAYEHWRGGEERPLPDLTAAAAIDYLRMHETLTQEGSAVSRRLLDEGISARFHTNDALLMAHATQAIGFAQP